jgi:hypothetical protein
VIAAPARSPARVRILYEDRRGPTNGFGLHELVLAAVDDVLRTRGLVVLRHVLAKRIVAIPKKSDSKVLAAVRDDAEQLHGGHSAVIAWLDDDKLHRALHSLAGNNSKAKKITAVRSLAPSSLGQRPGALEVFLVQGNIEALLQRIDAARPNTFSRTTLEAALDKDLSARDQCFVEIARRQHADWRAEVCRRDVSFDCVIRYVACLASYEPWPPW